MVIRLLILLGALLAGSFARAEAPAPYIRLSIGADRIVLGDSVVLEIEATGLEEPIDLAPLDAVAERVRETAGTRVAVYSGQVVDIRLRRIEIVPRAAGILVIGPFSAGAVSSNSVSVNVTEDRMTDWRPGSQDLRLDIAVSPVSPSLQQQVTAEIVFRHRHPVSSDRVTLPDFDGFRVMPVYEARRTVEDDWRVVRWRLLLFPQRSGAVSIPAARIAGTIQKSRLERAPFDLATDPVQITVQPAEGGGWWLPATNLRLSDSWSIDPTQLSAGGETERTITVTARGVLAEQVPDIVHPETRGLRITPLGEDRANKVTPDGVEATARFRFRIVALSPVPVFLDTVRLPWWDTGAGAADEAILPARRIDVGAPDASTLLAALASERRWHERLADAIRAAGLGPLLAIAASIPACLALWRLRPRIAATIGRLVREQTARRAIIGAGGDPIALHRVLRILRREGALSDEGRAVLAEVELRIFRTDTHPDGAAPVSLSRPARLLRIHAGATGRTTSSDALPPL